MPLPLNGTSACLHCGRDVDERPFAEIVASGQSLRPYLVYLWPLAGFLGLLYGVSIFLGQRKTAPILARTAASVSAPTSYPSKLTADDARRKADDARFWAAKARREAREVEGINAPPPLIAFSSTAPAAAMGDGGYSESSPSVAGARVVVTSGPSGPSNSVSASTPNAPPPSGLSGKTL